MRRPGSRRFARFKTSQRPGAMQAMSAVLWHALIPAERIQVKVDKGRVALKGELDWE